MRLERVAPMTVRGVISTLWREGHDGAGSDDAAMSFCVYCGARLADRPGAGRAAHTRLVPTAADHDATVGAATMATGWRRPPVATRDTSSPGWRPSSFREGDAESR